MHIDTVGQTADVSALYPSIGNSNGDVVLGDPQIIDYARLRLYI